VQQIILLEDVILRPPHKLERVLLQPLLLALLPETLLHGIVTRLRSAQGGAVGRVRRRFCAKVGCLDERQLQHSQMRDCPGVGGFPDNPDNNPGVGDRPGVGSAVS
jgi:hypothetical protein